MNKGLLYLLARASLITREVVHEAEEGQHLLRAVCPIHDEADCPSAFVLTTQYWLCNTQKCHETYGGRLEGLVVALAHRYGTFDSVPPFREAKKWVSRNTGLLCKMFADWETMKGTGRSWTRHARPVNYSRETVRTSLHIPSGHFLMRGFSCDVLRRYDIGQPRSRGVFGRLTDYDVVPLYDLGGTGKCVGYIARARYDYIKVRWKFSAGFPTGQRLFNYLSALETNRQTGEVILVEGVPDALRCIEAGFPQAVAVLGSSLYDEQMEWLTKMRLEAVTVVGDNDAAGAKFAKLVQERLAGHSRIVRVVHPPTHVKDVGDLTTQAAREFLKTVLSGSALVARSTVA
jgi:5S rRNA maturation endonuclease (ribonuclease M5)